MTDPMAEIKASFFIECEELLESLQDGLTVLQNDEGNSETINIVFRAVHSIKGGAGAFGLAALVEYAHRFETVLDALRAGTLETSDDLVTLLFRGADQLQDHVSAARDETAPPADSEEVLSELEAALGLEPVEDEPANVDFAPSGLDFSLDVDLDTDEDHPASAEGAGWVIRFAPLAGFYESGNEAQLQLRALAALGPLEVKCNPSQLSLDPDKTETPKLSWTVTLNAPVDEHLVHTIFEFVTDICKLDIKRMGDNSPDGGVTILDVAEPEDLSNTEAHQISSAAKTTHSDAAATIRTVVLGAAGSSEVPADTKNNAKADASEASVESAHTPKAKDAKLKDSVAKLATKSAHDAPAPTVRVDLERIDRLVNLVGELVINQAMLAQSVTDAGIGNAQGVVNGLDEFMNLTRDIQDSVMMIRAQPVKSLFQRMSRIVREASAAVDKNVRLETRGENTEIDKTVIERLSDPLTHMIRNAVDHGLETSASREAAGKSATGSITLSASHRAGRVLIEVRDDGQGINRERVFNIAVEKGLIDPEVQLTDTEIDNLLFLPGFSTASEVSALSGRGVGMDVVKNAIAALGGKISISSERGVGTTFSISLPLTLAVLDGMVIKAANQTLVMPISSIVETSTLGDHEREQVGPKSSVIRLRGELLPLVDLASSLGFMRPNEDKKPDIVLLTTSDDGSRRAFIVDSIMDQRQVVIKGLGDHFSHIPGVSAATILGDGQIALILDPSDIDGANSPGRPTNIVPLGDCA